MHKPCRKCSCEFEVTDADQIFYKKISVPEPTFCPQCRMMRRMRFRNEHSLYRRKCDLCKKDIIAAYKPDAVHPVYCTDCWWSDKWDATDFGMDVKVDEPFFPQMKALMDRVPRLSLAVVTSRATNCDFCNYVDFAKNCYLCYGSVQVEDCMYGNPYESKDCVDCFLVRESELAYECVDCEKMYNCDFCQSCDGCTDCVSCYECQGCNDCIGCTGLKRQQYCIANKKYSKEEYEVKRDGLKLATVEGLARANDYLGKEKLTFPHRSSRILKSEDCTGNFIVNSKNSHCCFDVKKLWDCSYCAQVIDGKDSYDVNYCEYFELCYEHIGFDENYNVKFSLISGNCKDCDYTDFCMNCNDCFGCVSLKKQKNCIFNKKYSEEEYRELTGRLREAMIERGEYGEYFPEEISPFKYEESVANDYFPKD
ncbi:hypothetical protein HOG17_03540 [Candidatus Peregrinibacteria bacterium]|jgi:hypothetical protein|nr:hypothetical protein [Candidatus Peregrinibacteria bacterium]MBT4148277.1 hypothetical protein [Candidatus Peregrinibacteria bacterium]MBT4366595.1 hypothetical protein [Candidatus Peregrinibacteria bacterium]MBT4456180.1 hypothetical protein [Candidatus Peregrinibacteria bacterium]